MKNNIVVFTIKKYLMELSVLNKVTVYCKCIN